MGEVVRVARNKTERDRYHLLKNDPSAVAIADARRKYDRERYRRKVDGPNREAFLEAKRRSAQKYLEKSATTTERQKKRAENNARYRARVKAGLVKQSFSAVACGRKSITT